MPTARELEKRAIRDEARRIAAGGAPRVAEVPEGGATAAAAPPAQPARKAPRKPGRPRKPRHVADYAQVGPAPLDPLEAAEWAGKLITVSMLKVAQDPDLDERHRRQELRQCAKAMLALIPAERLLQAERAVRKSADDMARPQKDAELTDVTDEPAGDGPLHLDS